MPCGLARALAFVLLVAPLDGLAPGVSVLPARRAPPRARPRANIAEGALLTSFEKKLKDFAPASELPELRATMLELEEHLEMAVDEQDFATAAMLRDDLLELRARDPAHVAQTLRTELEKKVRQERYMEAAACRDKLLVLRRFQPQYQLAGLWKGPLRPAASPPYPRATARTPVPPVRRPPVQRPYRRQPPLSLGAQAATRTMARRSSGWPTTATPSSPPRSPATSTYPLVRSHSAPT